MRNDMGSTYSVLSSAHCNFILFQKFLEVCAKSCGRLIAVSIEFSIFRWSDYHFRFLGISVCGPQAPCFLTPDGLANAACNAEQLQLRALRAAPSKRKGTVRQGTVPSSEAQSFSRRTWAAAGEPKLCEAKTST